MRSNEKKAELLLPSEKEKKRGDEQKKDAEIRLGLTRGKETTAAVIQLGFIQRKARRRVSGTSRERGADPGNRLARPGATPPRATMQKDALAIRGSK